jgi:hypothetical protein
LQQAAALQEPPELPEESPTRRAQALVELQKSTQLEQYLVVENNRLEADLSAAREAQQHAAAEHQKQVDALQRDAQDLLAQQQQLLRQEGAFELQQAQQQIAGLKDLLEQERAQQQQAQQQAQQQVAAAQKQAADSSIALHRVEQEVAASTRQLEQQVAAAVADKQSLSRHVPELSAEEDTLFRNAASALRLILSRAAPYLDVHDPKSDAAICEALAGLPFWYPDSRPASCSTCLVLQGFSLVEEVGGGGLVASWHWPCIDMHACRLHVLCGSGLSGSPSLC